MRFAFGNMLIFKYTKAERAKTIISEGRIRGSCALEMNDPFELTPTADPKIVDAKIIRAYFEREDTILRAYQKMGGFGDYEEFRKEYRATIPARVAFGANKIPIAVEAVREGFAARFDEKMRLICASKRFDSLLMWAHYANDHKGCAIGFDLDEQPFFGLQRTWVIEVQYSSEKALFKFNSRKPSVFYESMREIVGRKSPEWAYEEEVRIICPRLDERINPYFIQLPPRAFAVVVFGCRCDQKAKDSLTEMLNVPKYAHVSIYEASRNKSQFKLDFILLRKGNRILATSSSPATPPGS